MASRRFHFVDFQVQAAEIVDRARADAQQILRETRAEAERQRERARAEGMAEGREIAMREERTRLAAEIDRAVEQIVRLVREVEVHREALVLEAERDLVRLAVAIAEKIVRREIRAKAPVAEENLRAAIALVARRQGLVARIHPDDAKLIELQRIGPVTLQPDPTVERGGVVLQVGAGEVDAQVRTQLEQIERGLLE